MDQEVLYVLSPLNIPLFFFIDLYMIIRYSSKTVAMPYDPVRFVVSKIRYVRRRRAKELQAFNSPEIDYISKIANADCFLVLATFSYHR